MPDPSDVVAARIAEASAGRSVLIVALDGRSGAGKSTLAAAVAGALDAVVIVGDDFYAGGTVEEWRAMTPAERAARCIDWRRQRPVLQALRSGRSTSWHPYDWQAFDGRLAEQSIVADPAPVVLLEGAYSARPELAALLDLTILLDPPEDERRRRLREREGDAAAGAWESLWASAEIHHFGTVMPPDRFDLVVH